MRDYTDPPTGNQAAEDRARVQGVNARRSRAGAGDDVPDCGWPWLLLLCGLGVARKVAQCFQFQAFYF